jgi:hypothetical protein
MEKSRHVWGLNGMRRHFSQQQQQEREAVLIPAMAMGEGLKDAAAILLSGISGEATAVNCRGRARMPLVRLISALQNLIESLNLKRVMSYNRWVIAKQASTGLQPN